MEIYRSLCKVRTYILSKALSSIVMVCSLIKKCKSTSFAKFVLTVIFLIKPLNTSFAKGITTDRFTAPMTISWGLSLENYFTHNVTMSYSAQPRESVVSLLPVFSADLIRNFDDKFFLIAEASFGMIYNNIDSSGKTESRGMSTYARLGWGVNFLRKKHNSLAFVIGAEAMYDDIYSNPGENISPTKDLQSNLHFGGSFWFGLRGHLKVSEKQYLIIQARFGFGGVGVMFDGLKGSMPSEPGLIMNPSLLFEHRIEIFEKSYFRWFTGIESPFIYISEGVSSTNREEIFNHANIKTGIGFAFDI